MTDGSPAPSRGAHRLPLLGVLLLAALLRVWPWFAAHTFRGVQEYDDGVYFGTASLILRGALPYRDFTIVHPPAAPLLLVPFAALGELTSQGTGMAAARVFVLLVSLANVSLVFRCARALAGDLPRARWAALAAAAAYAVLPGAVVAEHTVLLEPLATLSCLTATFLLLRKPGRRWLLVIGALFALAVSTKLFAGAYLVVVIACLLSGRRVRDLTVLGAGVLLGLGVLVLPFVLMAPGALWHDVVVTQVSRPLDAGTGRAERLVDMVGFGPLPVALGTVLLLFLVVAVGHRAGQRQDPTYRWWLGLAVLIALAFASASSYFPHYGEFLAAPLAVLLGAIVLNRNPWVRRSVPLLLGAYLAGSVLALPTGGQGDLRTVGSQIPRGSCVFAESPSVAVATGHLQPPTASCPMWLDGRGVAYTQNTDWPSNRSFYFDGFTGDRRWQAALVEQLAHADYLLISRPPDRIREWAQSTRSYALQHFSQTRVLAGDGRTRVELWTRVPGR